MKDLKEKVWQKRKSLTETIHSQKGRFNRARTPKRPAPEGGKTDEDEEG